MSPDPAFSRNLAETPFGIVFPSSNPGSSVTVGPDPESPMDAFDAQLPACANNNLEHAAIEPLDPARFSPTAQRHGWKLVTVISGVLHAAIALAFFAAPDSQVSMEGADQAGIVLFGNASDDQASAGAVADPDATQVTLVTMSRPRPAETVAAETVPPDMAETLYTPPPEMPLEEAKPVQTAQAWPMTAIDEVASPDSVEPVAPDAADSVPEDLALPMVTQIAEPSRAASPQMAANVAATHAPVMEQRLVADASADILKAEVPRPDDKSEGRASPVDTERAHPLIPGPAEPVDVAPSVPLEADREPDATAAGPAQAEVKPRTQQAAIPDPPSPASPVPEPKPLQARPPRKVETDRRPGKQHARPATSVGRSREKAGSKAARQTATGKGKTGSGGKNAADARRGNADGVADGKAAQAGKRAISSADGNAAASNYPGKIAARLRRAASGISPAARARARKDVRVSFVVAASGGVAGVRIAQSSGSAELDAAALATVRRAAPFPPIPPEAGRSSWAFTVPLGLAR